MLYFVGLGLNPKQITKEAEDALKTIDKIYVECYTSSYSNDIKEVEKITKEKIILIYREDVELYFDKIINEAKKEDVAFCVFGNLTSATTHSSIILDAKNKKVRYKIIPGISIISVVPMLTGLEEYRFGRTVSIVKPVENYSPTGFFDYILENKKLGLHTLCLLDIKIEKNKKPYFMSCKDAAKRLLEISKERKQNIEDWNVIVVSSACSPKQKIKLAKLKELVKDKTNYTAPSCLVITGKISMAEEEFLQQL